MQNFVNSSVEHVTDRLSQRSHAAELLLEAFREEAEQIPHQRINGAWCHILLLQRAWEHFSVESRAGSEDSGAVKREGAALPVSKLTIRPLRMTAEQLNPLYHM